MDMFNTIKQLKQQNEAAFNFALAGIMALLLAIIGLAYLFNDVMEQKQIAKQVGDLQMIENRIQTIMSSKKFAYGEKVAFLEFENNVNAFNKQWFEFKGKYHYSTKVIKEVDEVWQSINDNAQIIVAKKKELMILREVLLNVNGFLKSMYQMNDDLINSMLTFNADRSYQLLAKELTVLLLRVEKQINFPFLGDENAVCACDTFERESENIVDILNGFLLGNPEMGIDKIKHIKVREIIEKQITLYEKIHSHVNTIRLMTPEIFQVRETQVAISRDSPQLKSALSKLNNHQLNKGLIVFVVCIWLVFFACMFGFLRALTSSEAKPTEVKTV